VDPCVSPRSIGSAGGGRKAAVDGGRLADERAAGDGTTPVVVADGLSLKREARVEDVEGVLLLGFEDDEKVWWWPATVKSASTARESRGGSDRGEAKEETKCERKILAVHTRKDKAAAHVGRLRSVVRWQRPLGGGSGRDRGALSEGAGARSV
jgi:hypothetical protein